MTQAVDYYYALFSPWTYLGHQRLEAIAARHGAVVRHKPVRLLELFQKAGTQMLSQRPPARQTYRMQELRRWRDFLGMPMTLQPAYFPVDDSLAAACVVAAQPQGKAGALSFAFLRAVWAEDRNIADSETVRAILMSEGLDADNLLAEAERPETAAQLDANTREGLAKGVFGLPSYVVGEELFWGQDRLDFVERKLAAFETPLRGSLG